MHKIEQWKQTKSYEAIQNHYGDRTAKRSGVRLMNHIDEGLEILREIEADDTTALGFCLHPLVQDPKQEKETRRGRLLHHCEWPAVRAAYMYREKANDYLCRPKTDNWSLDYISRRLKPMNFIVRDMLIADKIQNRKDFFIHHYGRHERSDQLARYFNNWLTFLSRLSDKDLFHVSDKIYRKVIDDVQYRRA